ncbi:MAG TPA: hypothetical protein VKD88_03085 [Gaiellaceae bacterium]|nr:hypothetical protein [Gaiellaceae bacterium]
MASAPAASCVQSQPAWIDYADKWVPFRHLFYRPGLAVALAHTAPGAAARSSGAEVAYWDMSLRDTVGTPAHPAGSGTVAARVGRLADAAGKVTGCATPIIALNELYGAHLQAPWSRSNAAYRANVLELVRGLASRGALPHLLISEAGATRGATGSWWRSLAASAVIVRELYIPAPTLARLGPSGATVYLRFQLRRAVRNFTNVGIPSNRIGLALGFHSGRGGRAGLRATRWFGVVKREALAARQVAAELALDSVWSWGWARFAGMSNDPAKATAACVYLWARDPSLCDAAAVAGRGFDSSRSQPAEVGDRVGMSVLSTRHPVWLEVRATAKLAARVASVQERTATGWRSLNRIVLAPFHPMRMRIQLANGRHVLRLFVAAESAPGGAARLTAPLAVVVH